jgi:hypothetical protein
MNPPYDGAHPERNAVFALPERVVALMPRNPLDRLSLGSPVTAADGGNLRGGTAMTPARPLAVGVVTLGIASVVAAPVPAIAAPAPCERAERYAAQSGVELLRLNRLDLRPAGRDAQPITDAGLGESKSALVTDANVASAAVTRMLDAQPGGGNGQGGSGKTHSSANGGDGQAVGVDLTDPLIQQAPPAHAKPTVRSTASGAAGPFTLGDGTLNSHARWSPGMACAAEEGEVTRAEAALGTATIVGDDDDALIAVPETISTRSTTALEGHGPVARSVAGGSLDVHRIELFGGAVHVTVKRPPALTASMSTQNGGEVRYVPAMVEVSGAGVDTPAPRHAGDDVEITVDGTRPTESAAPGGPLASLLPKAQLGRLTAGTSLPLPTVPGVPPIGAKDEAAQVAGPGTILRISLGDVRQATAGHAVAARATAIKIAVTQRPGSGRTARGYGGRGGVVLDLDVCLLAAAAVAPEPAAVGGGVEGVSAGAGSGPDLRPPGADLLESATASLPEPAVRGRYRLRAACRHTPDRRTSAKSAEPSSRSAASS